MLDRVVARAASLVTRTPPPQVFTELGRHPRLFRAWLPFAGSLLLQGKLPRADTELVILRTAWNCDCAYEWAQHIELAPRSGLDVALVDSVGAGVTAPVWTSRQRALLGAVDELHADRTLTAETRDQLERFLDEREVIELCLLVGHYEMLAMVLNSRGVEPDVPMPESRRQSWDLGHWSNRQGRRTLMT